MEVLAGKVNANLHDAVTEEMIGERRLWTAVIVAAVQDWRAGTLRARREAQEFLFEKPYDFSLVCTNAGLDPDSLRTQLLKIGRRIEMVGPHGHPLAA